MTYKSLNILDSNCNTEQEQRGSDARLEPVTELENLQENSGKVATKQVQLILDQVLNKHQKLLDSALLDKAYSKHSKKPELLKKQFLKLLVIDVIRNCGSLTEQNQITDLFNYLEKKIDAVLGGAR